MIYTKSMSGPGENLSNLVKGGGSCAFHMGCTDSILVPNRLAEHNGKMISNRQLWADEKGHLIQHPLIQYQVFVAENTKYYQ